MNYNDIAIIGMSARVSDADNLEDLREIFKEKRDCVTEVKQDRLQKLFEEGNNNFLKCNYIKNIDCFDHEFFNIPSKEADMMSPEQRLSIEVVAKTILDSGYSLNKFRGKNCGVIFTSNNSDYLDLLGKKIGPSILGDMQFMLSGKISYLFDLQGPNIMCDAGCSSGLLAVHEACVKLMTNQIDYALVGGANLMINIPKKGQCIYDILSLLSKSDGKGKSFDDSADGAGLGEGVACVLLKRLKDAEKDKDNIYGVIKSGAINGDGARCSRVTIPSAQAQKDVMLEAWKGINLLNMTEIEGHGIGSQIGDSIEALSLIEALKENGVSNSQNILLGASKSNIGHTFYASGIFSLIKVLLGYKYNESYPIVNYNTPNHLVDFKNSPLTPLTNYKKWNKEEERLTGIDCFGLSGTNSHIVVKNYNEASESSNFTRLVKFSARTESSFWKYKNELIEYLDNNEVSLDNLIYTLNTGRDDYDVRRAFSINDYEDFREKLDLMSPSKVKFENYKLIFVVKREEENSSKIESYLESAPGLLELYDKVTENTDLNFKYAMIRYLRRLGVKSDAVLADLSGKAIINFIDNKISKEELDAIVKENNIGNYEKIIDYVHKSSSSSNIVVLDFSDKNILKNEKWNKNVKIFNLTDAKDLEKFLVFHYNNGRQINWDGYYGEKTQRKVSIPTYCFEEDSHWAIVKKEEKQVVEEKVRTNYVENVVINKEIPEIKEDTSYEIHTNKEFKEKNNKFEGNTDKKEAEEFLESLWKNILNYTEEIEHDEDFFYLGGNSLLIIQMSDAINEHFNVDFDVYEIYDYETIEKLADRILEYVAEEGR